MRYENYTDDIIEVEGGFVLPGGKFRANLDEGKKSGAVTADNKLDKAAIKRIEILGSIRASAQAEVDRDVILFSWTKYGILTIILLILALIALVFPYSASAFGIGFRSAVTDLCLMVEDGGLGQYTKCTPILVDANGGLSAVNHILFDTTPVNTDTEGAIQWNDTDKTINLNTEVAGTKIQVGQESVVRVTNKTGSQIDDGKAVYINGAQGSRPTIALADADNLTDVSQLIGLTTQDIADNATGYVTTQGLVRDVNTNAWAAGTVLYVDTTAGGLTDTKPTVPSYPVQIATVVVQNATTGILFVDTRYGDIVSTPSSATDNAIVRWDNTTGNHQQNSLAILGDNGTINIPAGQEYQVNGIAIGGGTVPHWISAGAMTPTATNGASLSTEEYATNDINIDYANFSDTTPQFTEFDLYSDDAGTVTATFWWTADTDGVPTETTEFGIACGTILNDGAIDTALGTFIETTDTYIADGDMHVTATSAAITCANAAANQLTHFKIEGTTDGTGAWDSRLIAVLIQY
ncbi:MAG: DUF2190 family protein [Candidatus Peribacteraceae bacterium]|nr:DUF2190 family protein [Candidatus Peribacteraceae bacterium]